MTQPDLVRLEVSARDQQIEAICQARCLQPGLHWSDGMTEGVARIEQMLAERCLDALALPALLARVRELEAVVGFYADEARWTPNSAMITSAMDDRGHRARAALILKENDCG